jgi:hypothetical protein
VFGKMKLSRDGAQIHGLLVESDADKTPGANSYHVKVRVTFEDGTTAEFTQRLHPGDAGLRGLGAAVPVHYDPADRSNIAVDEAQMRDDTQTAQAQRQAAFDAIDTAPLPTDPAAALQALWEQMRALDERGSELRRTGAPRAEVGVWVAQREAVDARFRTLKLDHPDWTPTRG